MLCWNCQSEMYCEFDTAWKNNKYGDRIRTSTFVCWDCRNILKIQATEVREEE